MKLKIFNLKSQLLIYFFILTITTLIIRLANLDLWVSDLWFFRDTSWISRKDPFWEFVYKFFAGPSIYLLFAACLAYVFHWLISQKKQLQLKALCIILAIVIGPGVIVHGILKPTVDRPRPYDIERYKGTDSFVPVLERGEDGVSFPSGHAAAGFVLTILFYVFYRTRKRLAWTCWWFGLGLGTVLSVARIGQGGHFLSDCLWAFGITQITNILVYFSLEPKILAFENSDLSKKPVTQKRKIIFSVTAIGLTTIFAVSYLLNFPFSFHQVHFYKVPPEITTVIYDAPLDREKVKIFDTGDRSVGIDYLAFANGFPWSDAEAIMSTSIQGNVLIYSVQMKYQGAFRGYKGRMKLFLPKGIKVDLSPVKGEIVENLSTNPQVFLGQGP